MRYPDYHEQEVHKFTVALVAVITGESPAEISANFPGYGLTGSPSTLPEFTWYSDLPAAQIGTSIHDITSEYNHVLPDISLNKLVWGYETDFWSALAMYGEALLASPSDSLIVGVETIFDFLVDQVGDLSERVVH